MLAAIFVTEGFNALRSPQQHAVKAKPVTDRISSLHPSIPSDPATLVRINGAAQVLGGALLATGRVTTPASLVLAASLVPTTLAGHAFWELDDPQERRMQRINFLKNAGLLGGLLFAALDNEGRPGLRWRTTHGAGQLKRRTAHQAHHASDAARRALRKARDLATG